MLRGRSADDDNVSMCAHSPASRTFTIPFAPFILTIPRTPHHCGTFHPPTHFASLDTLHADGTFRLQGVVNYLPASGTQASLRGFEPFPPPPRIQTWWGEVLARQTGAGRRSFPEAGEQG